jgi:hypothetical protein
MLLPLNALPISLTATAALSYGSSYSAASPECLTSNQFHLLQLLLLFLTALLTLLLHLNALPVPNSLVTAIAALSHDLLTLLLLPNSLTMTKLPLLRPLLLSLRPYTYYAASAELPNSDQTPPLTAIAALLRELLPLLLLLIALPTLKSLSYSYCCSF